MRIFLDFEANGSPRQEVISIGAISQDESLIYYSLIKPTHPIDNYVRKITHLTQEQLDKAPEATDIFRHFYKKLQQLVGDEFIWDKIEFYVYGSEDARFLRESAKSVKDPEIYNFLIALSYNLIDYQKIRIVPYFHRHMKLVSALQFYRPDEEIEQDHNALGDAMMLLDLFDLVPKSENGNLDIEAELEAGRLSLRATGHREILDFVDIKAAVRGFAGRQKNATKPILKRKITAAALQGGKYFGYNWEVIKHYDEAGSDQYSEISNSN